jgi:6-pyruvoyltetrahydropterin/6-carboxytetrahydropterin synthase
MFEISVKFHFSSAHQLRGYKGKCEELHGHNWEVEVFLVSNRLNKLGMVLDFNIAKRNLKKVIKKLDHKFINKIPYFRKNNPTSENLAKFIFYEMRKLLKSSKVKITKVDIWETSNSHASYYLVSTEKYGDYTD